MFARLVLGVQLFDRRMYLLYRYRVLHLYSVKKMIRGPYKRYLREADPMENIPSSTRYDKRSRIVGGVRNCDQQCNDENPSQNVSCSSMPQLGNNFSQQVYLISTQKV